MRVPHTVPKSVLEAYRCSDDTAQLAQERGRTIRPESENWDASIIPNLKILALRVLAARWEENMILETLTCDDKEIMLEMLPLDLPFEFIIKNIPYEHYWKLVAKNRWEFNDPEKHGNSWRQLYCERHLAEYLERLEPAFFESEENAFYELLELLKEYIWVLRIRSLVPEKNITNWTIEGDFPVHHVPLNLIIPRLPNLQELEIRIGVFYMNDGFEWRDFEFSVTDCVNLGRSIEGCPNLRKFRLTRSNLNQPRAAALLQQVAVNNTIEEMDVSHCKLGDEGGKTIGAFLARHDNCRHLRILHLANNNIGPNGLAGISQGLLQDSSVPLKRLNLRLNPLRDPGGSHLCALLLRHEQLEYLNVSGCELGPSTGANIADVISSGNMKIPELIVDVSNNGFGPIAGKALELAIKLSSIIVGFDGRMCNFTKQSEYLINESIDRLLETSKRAIIILPNYLSRECQANLSNKMLCVSVFSALFQLCGKSVWILSQRFLLHFLINHGGQIRITDIESNEERSLIKSSERL